MLKACIIKIYQSLTHKYLLLHYIRIMAQFHKALEYYRRLVLIICQVYEVELVLFSQGASVS